MGTSEVYAGDIGHSYLQIVKFVIVFGLKRTWDGVKFIANALRFVFTWLIYSIQAMPMYIAFIIIAILMCFFWNETLKPLILLLIEGYNGAIRSWNELAGFLRNMGFSIPLPTGSVDIPLGIPVPNGDEVSVDIPDFIPFVMDILVPVLFKPLRNYLTGIIFAEDE